MTRGDDDIDDETLAGALETLCDTVGDERLLESVIGVLETRGYTVFLERIDVGDGRTIEN